MNNKLNLFPEIALHAKQNSVRIVFNWAGVIAALILMIIILSIITLVKYIKVSGIETSIEQGSVVLADLQLQLREDLGEDRVASLNQFSMKRLAGFSDYFSPLTKFRVEDVWVNRIMVELEPELEPNKQEVIIEGQAQQPEGAQSYYSKLTAMSPYDALNIHLSIPSESISKKKLTKRELRIQKAKGLISDSDPVLFDFIIRTPEKIKPKK